MQAIGVFRGPGYCTASPSPAVISASPSISFPGGTKAGLVPIGALAEAETGTFGEKGEFNYMETGQITPFTLTDCCFFGLFYSNCSVNSCGGDELSSVSQLLMDWAVVTPSKPMAFLSAQRQ